MKNLTIPMALSLALLTGCGLQTLAGSTYDGFEGKFIEQETNAKPNQNEEKVATTDKEKDGKKDSTSKPNNEANASHALLVNLRAASDKDLMQNPRAHKYLTSILDKVVAAWGKPLKEPVYISITTDCTYSASANKDTIMVSLGMLADVNSEDELAFNIAHELSHILLAHHETGEYFEKQKALVSKAANVAMITASFSDVSTSKTTSGYQVTNELSDKTANKVGDIYKAGLTINRLSRDVISSSMTRLNEDEADLLAIDLMAKAGYSPSAYIKVMQRLESSQNFTKEQLAEKKADFQNFVSLASSANENISGFNKETLLYFAANEASTRLLQMFAERHNSPDERKKDLARYVKREYRSERKRALNTKALEKNLRSGIAQQISENYWYASEAMRLLEAGDIKQAEALAKRAVTGKTKHHAYPRLAFYAVRKEQGEHKKALANLRMIKDWDYASIQTFNTAAQAFRHLKQPGEAKKILSLAEKSVGTPLPFYPEYILTYQAMGKTQLVKQTFDTCATVEEENIVNQCHKAAGIPLIEESGGSVTDILGSMTTLIPL